MTPTEQLKEELGGVKVMLRIIGKICDRMESGKAVPVRHLLRVALQVIRGSEGRNPACRLPPLNGRLSPEG